MKWLQKLMFGRYGTDQLSLFLLVTSMLCSFIAAFFDAAVYLILQALSYAMIATVVWRMMSRNIERRRAENQKFMKPWRKLSGTWKRRKAQRKDTTHHYFKCKQCGATLRIPKGVGNVVITCPRCKAKAEGKA